MLLLLFLLLFLVLLVTGLLEGLLHLAIAVFVVLTIIVIATINITIELLWVLFAGLMGSIVFGAMSIGSLVIPIFTEAKTKVNTWFRGRKNIAKIK